MGRPHNGGKRSKTQKSWKCQKKSPAQPVQARGADWERDLTTTRGGKGERKKRSRKRVGGTLGGPAGDVEGNRPASARTVREKKPGEKKRGWVPRRALKLGKTSTFLNVSSTWGSHKGSGGRRLTESWPDRGRASAIKKTNTYAKGRTGACKVLQNGGGIFWWVFLGGGGGDN